MSRLTDAETRILRALNDSSEPLFNGNLAVDARVSWRSKLFARLENRGLIAGHPFKITPAGRAAIARAEDSHV